MPPPNERYAGGLAEFHGRWEKVILLRVYCPHDCQACKISPASARVLTSGRIPCGARHAFLLTSVSKIALKFALISTLWFYVFKLGVGVGRFVLALVSVRFSSQTIQNLTGGHYVQP